METETMGRVTVTAKIENLGELVLAEKGLFPANQIRALEVHDAIVDTRATILSMPKRMIQQLGLDPLHTRKAMTSDGIVTVQVYAAVRLTIEGRDCATDVVEVPDDRPVLIGRIILHQLDLVVDTPRQRLTRNPAHGGVHMIEIY
jgi:predicted aspartyl protease